MQEVMMVTTLATSKERTSSLMLRAVTDSDED